jgi:hypothetical protein
VSEAFTHTHFGMSEHYEYQHYILCYRLASIIGSIESIKYFLAQKAIDASWRKFGIELEKSPVLDSSFIYCVSYFVGKVVEDTRLAPISDAMEGERDGAVILGNSPSNYEDKRCCMYVVCLSLRMYVCCAFDSLAFYDTIQLN